MKVSVAPLKVSRAHQTVIVMGIIFVTKSYFLRLDKEDKYF
jgi:hypothetical protein